MSQFCSCNSSHKKVADEYKFPPFTRGGGGGGEGLVWFGRLAGPPSVTARLEKLEKSEGNHSCPLLHTGRNKREKTCSMFTVLLFSLIFHLFYVPLVHSSVLVHCSVCLLFHKFTTLLARCFTCSLLCLFAVLRVHCSACSQFHVFTTLLFRCFTCSLFNVFAVSRVHCSVFSLFYVLTVPLLRCSTCLNFDPLY